MQKKAFILRGPFSKNLSAYFTIQTHQNTLFNTKFYLFVLYCFLEKKVLYLCAK
jgi:hypothetical protein